MKKLMVMIFAFITSFAYANSWQDDWITAVELCENKNYDQALHFFDSSVEQLIQNGDTSHSYVFVDRGRLHLLFERNELALQDFDFAINMGNMSQHERMVAHLSRMMARVRLGMNKGVLEDLEKFSENNPNSPTMEKTENRLIVRNAPNSKCYEDIMTCYYIHSGQCLSKKDIKILKSGTWIINTQCGCESCKGILSSERCCDHCGAKLSAMGVDPRVENCCNVCDHMAIAGAAWCSNHFRFLRCQVACGLAVEQIKKGCYWCCRGDGFYENCIKPFECILDYIKQPCDPQFD